MIRQRFADALDGLQEALRRPDRELVTVEQLTAHANAQARQIGALERTLGSWGDTIRSQQAVIDAIMRTVGRHEEERTAVDVADDRIADLWTYARETRTLTDQNRESLEKIYRATHLPTLDPKRHQVLEDG